MLYQTYTARKVPSVKVKGQGHRYMQQTGPFCRCLGDGSAETRFLSLVILTLTFDLDLETRLSEGPNTKPYLRAVKTTDWRRQKENLPQFTACGNNIFICQRQRRFCMSNSFGSDVVLFS